MGLTKTTIATVCLCFSAVLGGCVASTPSARGPSGGSVADQQIALDFANAITQIEALPPDETLLRFPHGGKAVPVLDALRLMLAEAGYAVQRVPADGGGGEEGAVRYRVAAERDEPGARRHEIRIGEIGLRRVYRAADGERVRPVSALFVKGADPRAIRMVDEQLFGIESSADSPDAMPEGEEGPPAATRDLLASYEYLTAEDDPGAEALRTAVDPRGVDGEGGEKGGERGDERAGAALSLEPVRNVRELGGSNFADVLDARELVVEHVIGFERGSDRLDRDDVVLIDDVLGRFDPDTDLIAVTGYSSGGAAGAEYNRGMALRRAKRVKGALTAVGVPHERVLTEGYWSNVVPADEVPGRAAVVRLSRRAAPS